jgi:hypothetical protein
MMNLRRDFLALACMLGSACFMMAQPLSPVVKSSFTPFNVGEIRPEGWLHDWAQTAANGMTKTLGEKFWPFTTGWADNTQCDWWPYEQSGYYADGLVRLAFVLNDSTLINRASKLMQTVVDRQTDDGYIYSNCKKFRDNWNTPQEDYGVYWSQAVFARAALAYYSATKDERVLKMLEKCYAGTPIFDRSNEQYPLSGVEMDQDRKLVGLEIMLELVRYSGNKDLLDKALKIYKANESGFVDSWAKNKDFFRTAICHGVTYNEVAKLYAVGYPWTGRTDYRDASTGAFEFMQQHFVLPNGAPSSNEYLHGIGAFEGSETCDISDFIWSNIWLARATGEAKYGDRIEKAFFNAFPAVMSPGFSLHLYENAMNRIPGLHIKVRDDGSWFKELHWPTCCTGNLNRVIPNYIINMFMRNEEQELMVLTYGPAHLATHDGMFNIKMETQYPFRDQVNIEINAMPKGEKLLLRVPDWCETPQCTVNGKNYSTKWVENHFIAIARKWKAGDRITLTFPMKAELKEGDEQFARYKDKEPYWPHDMDPKASYTIDGFNEGAHFATINYGALVFALPLMQHSAWSFDLNEGYWQEYRYALNKSSLKDAKVTTIDMQKPFYWELSGAPISISVNADILSWEPAQGDPKLPKVCTPIKSNVPLKLIPYGFAHFRVAMFPCER